MSNPSARPGIRLRGVRHNNLKNFDLDLPLNQLIVITGVSGSGKSSLVFDTLYAEGQRRYIETFSPYARQFLDRMDKPQVDSIEGIPPAIAVEQRNTVRTTRSTVGTMTEICDYLKLVWPHVSHLHCRQCGQPVQRDPPQAIWKQVTSENSDLDSDLLITFELPLTQKLSLEESLALVTKQGYQRLLARTQILRIEEFAVTTRAPNALPEKLTVVQDRLKAKPQTRSRFIEACEQAYHFGKGKLQVWYCDGGDRVHKPRPFSVALHCAPCDLAYRDPSPALFSYNHPLGACPTCRGFGRIISIDYHLAVPDRTRTLAEGVVKPWLTGRGAECQEDLLRICSERRIPVHVPFYRLPVQYQNLVLNGDPDYDQDEDHQWPKAWYGLKGYFRWLESKAYKMHVRVLLSRYRTYTPCPDCHGQRMRPEALLYRLDPALSGDHPTTPGFTLADFYALPVCDALLLMQGIARKLKRWATHSSLELALDETCSRLAFLDRVGLGYLTLARATRSLSGGETERVNLTTCLGTKLVNTLYVLDEPSVGLHPRDTNRLIGILEQLRDQGNTVVVVEHEASIMRAADQIIDLGPGHGATGGEVVFQGTYKEILKAPLSLTGQYLSSNSEIPLPIRRECPPLSSQRTHQRDRHTYPPSPPEPAVLNDRPGLPPASTSKPNAVLTVSHANRHNLHDLTVGIPLSRLVCITGVSGSGKTTLVKDVLFPGLTARLKTATTVVKASDRMDPDTGDQANEDPDVVEDENPVEITGWENVDRVVLVDQSALGKTPRSNPVVYIGAFDAIRAFYAESVLARQRGLSASVFSFNSAQGQCQRCRGAGFEKIEMQFLSDVFIRCPECDGKRYQAHVLEVKIPCPKPHPEMTAPSGSEDAQPPHAEYSIADVLDSTVEEAVAFLNAFPESKPARRAAAALRWLQEVGLGYLKLGQPINTLSGGESQRLKLVRHLAEVSINLSTPQAPSDEAASRQRRVFPSRPTRPPSAPNGSVLFLFDEPTTGLHFDDIRVLLDVFQRMVNCGHSVVIIEHNLDVIKSADWVIDLGPESGDQGGRLVAQGPPELIAKCPKSHTGKALRTLRAFNCRQNRKPV